MLLIPLKTFCFLYNIHEIFYYRPEVIVIDLTIPWEGRVDAARSEKLAKFAKLVTAIKAIDAFNVTYQSIEIGSYRQRLSDGSESAMKILYNYITPTMSFDAFRCNLINLVNLSSYEVSRSYIVFTLLFYFFVRGQFLIFINQLLRN